jgi:hypothetical protein
MKLRIWKAKGYIISRKGPDIKLTGDEINDRGLIPGRDKNFCTLPPPPYRIWILPTFAFNAYREQRDQTVKLTTDNKPLAMSRMRGTLPPYSL